MTLTRIAKEGALAIKPKVPNAETRAAMASPSPRLGKPLRLAQIHRNQL